MEFRKVQLTRSLEGQPVLEIQVLEGKVGKRRLIGPVQFNPWNILYLQNVDINIITPNENVEFVVSHLNSATKNGGAAKVPMTGSILADLIPAGGPIVEVIIEGFSIRASMPGGGSLLLQADRAKLRKGRMVLAGDIKFRIDGEIIRDRKANIFFDPPRIVFSETKDRPIELPWAKHLIAQLFP